MTRVLALLLVLILAPAWGQNRASVANNYQLGSGDLINIHVYGEDDLSLETRIGESGVLNYPYLGLITLKGLTVAELESFITKGLSGDYLINPSVHVSVIEYRPFYIYGEVNTPGGYPYQPGLTIERAVALAGGLTERAADDRITINRPSGARERTLRANMSTSVLPGDTVFIKDSFF